MDQIAELSEEAVRQLQAMLDTPIENQATTCELALLGSLLQKGLLSLQNSESTGETCDILRQLLKSAFVIGRRHVSQLA